MRFLFTIILIGLFTIAQAQTKTDTIQLIRHTAKMYDLDFTDGEADSIIGNLYFNLQLYKGLHKTLPTNDIPYPFVFDPLPHGYSVPTQQQKISWNIPNNVQLPSNKNDLAFYSIMQLASLIKNKKISSVELTKFFIDRLKKWSDTLQCTITLTEELAMKEAQQADDDLKKGIYHGPLHGIPYGLKDLFAVKGYKTTWGTTPSHDQVIDENSFVYKQLKQAGAVLCA